MAIGDVIEKLREEHEDDLARYIVKGIGWLVTRWKQDRKAAERMIEDADDRLAATRATVDTAIAEKPE